ncbi:MAG: response regulator [Acidobacteria bacterium]|nr:response regulator [Acidobacteriota bacterium]
MTTATNNADAVQIPRGRILHAEDDEMTSILITRYLTEKGYEVETVANGVKALRCVLKHPGYFDLIISDQVMPELTGVEWLTTLRKTGYPGKIIVFAAQFSADVETQFRAVGVDRILWKSADLTPLHDTIEELLNTPHTAGECKFHDNI